MFLSEDIFEQWINNVNSSTTIQQYRSKVYKYIQVNKNLSIEEALSEEKLADFIYNKEGKAEGKYYALFNLCNYVYINLLNNKDYNFPISLREVKEFDNQSNYKTKRKKYNTNYLEDTFMLKELFNDEYYSHLQDQIATITIKAVLSCALSAGLGTGELLMDYSNPNYLSVDDIKIVNLNQIEIVVYGNMNLDKIRIPEESSKYIIDYINIRKSGEEKVRVKKRLDEKEAFFIKLWSGYNLNIDTEIFAKKPSNINELVTYMLKYICARLNITELSLNDMRSNKVYHELIVSKGSALNDIIKMHGYVTFVEDAFQRFIDKHKNKVSLGFDFFNVAPLSDIRLEEADNGVMPGTYMTLIERKKRNRKIVEELKNLYENKCQVCGETIDLGNEVKYSEVNHIQPIGKEHNGSDNKHNMIVLCPNHHTMFDLGIISIDPADCCTLIHINKNSNLNNKHIEFKHLISNTSIRYHYDHIYLKLVRELER